MNRRIVMLILMAVICAAILLLTPDEAPIEAPAQPAGDSVGTHGETPQAPASIAWIDAGVEQGFVRAARERKPIFLYWGADWCPPCNELKATIFKRPDFIAKTRLFIPVYIDGDGVNAQRYQEQFKTFGYPTMIVFSPDAQEITRIPGGIDLERYVEVLDLALEQITPVAKLVARVIEEDYQPSHDELRLLAYYSWGQDSGKALAERDKTVVFDALRRRVPASMPEVSARLTARYLSALADSADDLDAASVEMGRQLLLELLADDRLSAASPYFVATRVDEVIDEVSTAETPERELLLSAWQSRLDLDWQSASPGIYSALLNLEGQLGLAKLRDIDISEEIKARVRQAVAEAYDAAGDVYMRITVVNQSYALLHHSEQTELAEQMLLKELGDDVNDYYWMRAMANLAEKTDRPDEAVNWMRKAYDNAEGLATRITWGSVFVAALTRLTPGAADDIGATVDGVFAELASQADPVHGWNSSSIRRIARALHGWADQESADPQRNTVLAQAKQHFEQLCGSDIVAAQRREECLALFDKPSEDPVG